MVNESWLVGLWGGLLMICGDDDGDDADADALKSPQPPYKCRPNAPPSKSLLFSGSPPRDLIYQANAETAAPNTSKAGLAGISGRS